MVDKACKNAPQRSVPVIAFKYSSAGRRWSAAGDKSASKSSTVTDMMNETDERSMDSEDGRKEGRK
jgi:hypothetical protein